MSHVWKVKGGKAKQLFSREIRVNQEKVRVASRPSGFLSGIQGGQ
jgi:hypothetical protein